MNILEDLILALQQEIDLANKEREQDELGRLKQVHLKILGQSALMFNTEISERVILNQTQDLHAIIEGNWSSRTLVKRAIAKIGLVYDDLSKEIWIPSGSRFKIVYENSEIKLEVLDPYFVFLSKAVKAPEKNKELIIQALAIYGEKLALEIVKEGGKLEHFI